MRLFVRIFFVEGIEIFAYKSQYFVECLRHSANIQDVPEKIGHVFIKYSMTEFQFGNFSCPK